ncbi:MAG: hypothetical protein ACOX17_08955 [Christensenellales bacterium]|jgi:hypothetical protein
MAFIQKIDSEKHAVLTIQVENEMGVIGAAREHSDQAEVLFASLVPAEFAAHMRRPVDAITPEMKKAVVGGKTAGSWADVSVRKPRRWCSAFIISPAM